MLPRYTITVMVTAHIVQVLLTLAVAARLVTLRISNARVFVSAGEEIYSILGGRRIENAGLDFPAGKQLFIR